MDVIAHRELLFLYVLEMGVYLPYPYLHNGGFLFRNSNWEDSRKEKKEVVFINESVCQSWPPLLL